jgi:hydrogenase-4 component B
MGCQITCDKKENSKHWNNPGMWICSTKQPHVHHVNNNHFNNKYFKMNIIIAFIVITLTAVFTIPFLKSKWKSAILFTVILLNALLSGYFAVQTLLGYSYEFLLPGSLVTGLVPLRIDALSGWFMLIINFVFVTGVTYGIFYLKTYPYQKNNISLHAIAFILLHAALIGVCVIQNSIVFLISWEIVALSAFLVVIFEHEKVSIIQAGINYLIQSHVCIVFLMIGFIWVAHKTGSYDFAAITTYATNHNETGALLLFICFFVGFAIKAGFVPFHTWLPYAHPAAPSHISGIMSGVIIKIGVFGILRMILLIKTDYLVLGYFILLISLLSGIYGVMLAIIQHNLKRLLAYHSIENIGIIGIGIGIGCIGLGTNNNVLASLGFAGAMLHVLNHALFKSLLFYTAGNISQYVHNLNLESLGGLIRKMPQTATLFLIASIAICGIPPFNGFISEFIIYIGLYNWLQNATLVPLITIIFTVLGFVMIGGLAILCFTKAFGIVFLGDPRYEFKHEIKEAPFIQLLPLYLIALFILFIGLFPKMFLALLIEPVNLLTGNEFVTSGTFQGRAFDALQTISWAGWGFILLVILILLLRRLMMYKRTTGFGPTWACGYIAPSPRQQYTAGSFVRSYSKLFSSVLLSFRSEKEIRGTFPTEGHYESHPYDKIEEWLIDNPLRAYRSIMGKFIFLQNGKLQFYILYGIIFIVSVICIPLFYEKIIAFIDFLKQL